MAKDVYLPGVEDGLSRRRKYMEVGAHRNGGFYPRAGLCGASQDTLCKERAPEDPFAAGSLLPGAVQQMS